MPARSAPHAASTAGCTSWTGCRQCFKALSACTGRWRSAPAQRQTAPCTCQGYTSHTSSVLLATLACIRTAPHLLWRRPSGHPIRETCVAVVRRRRGANGGTTIALARAALTMDMAAPSLLPDSPAGLPIRESISTVVRVGWGRRRGWLPADMVVCAAPVLLRRHPGNVLMNGAVIWIDRAVAWWDGRRHRGHRRKRSQGWRHRRKRSQGWRRGGGWRGRWSRQGGGRRGLRG